MVKARTARRLVGPMDKASMGAGSRFRRNNGGDSMVYRQPRSIGLGKGSRTVVVRLSAMAASSGEIAGKFQQ